jgi:glycosyltransferase involved in cell wall biosynthesis
MKIVFLTRYFYPHIGGVEKHCLKLGKELVKKGHSLTIITSSESLKEKSKNSKEIIVKEVEGIKVIYINSGKVNWSEKFRAWNRLYRLKTVIKEASVVHCHDIFYWYLPFKFIFPGKKVFITFHGYEGNKIPNRRAEFVHMLSEKLSDGNICIGSFFTKWYKTKPTFITYGACDLNLKATLIKNKNTKAMFLGRLEEETGIMDYLEALKLLKEKGIGISLDVFGDGSLLEQAMLYSKISGIDVKFKGFVETAERHISNYDFIFTSRYLGILESLAAKKSVFAVYNNKIKKDYLKMTPFEKLISISPDSQSLRDEIIDYLRNKKLTDKQRETAFNLAKKYSWVNLANLYLKLWSFD